MNKLKALVFIIAFLVSTKGAAIPPLNGETVETARQIFSEVIAEGG